MIDRERFTQERILSRNAIRSGGKVSSRRTVSLFRRRVPKPTSILYHRGRAGSIWDTVCMNKATIIWLSDQDRAVIARIKEL